MIFEIISGGEKTDWVGKEWAGLFFPRGKIGPAHSFPGEKTDWGEIPACYTGIKLATPGSAVRHASVARHVTDCATRPGSNSCQGRISVYRIYIFALSLMYKGIWAIAQDFGTVNVLKFGTLFSFFFK